MEIRLVDVENCGGITVTVTGELLTNRVVEVRVLEYAGRPGDDPPTASDDVADKSSVAS
ncbi:hypothetical protein [Sorangium sp. So ce1153]|uniref:hypothetical protein n=1 Tax=Sorangium sp. So ce1153 TaxID=3133333 RepID=UPI003F5DB992